MERPSHVGSTKHALGWAPEGLLGALLALLVVPALCRLPRAAAQATEVGLALVPSGQFAGLQGVNNSYLLNFGTIDGVGAHKPLGVTVTPVQDGAIYSVRIDMVPTGKGGAGLVTIMVRAEGLRGLRPDMIVEGDSIENLKPVPPTYPGKIIAAAARPGTMVSRVVGIYAKHSWDYSGPVSVQLVFTIVSQ